MKKAILFSILVCLVIALPAKVSLYVVLEKVAKEPNVRAAVKVGEDGVFDDSLISITWDARTDGFQFQLTNKTNTKLSIPWGECRFIDETGGSYIVVHGEAGAVLEIEAKGIVSGVVAPVDYFYWQKGWTIQAIYQNKMADEEFEAVKDKDLIYKVILPIRSGKTKTVYHFIFNTIAE
jgi:hypothetical protein